MTAASLQSLAPAARGTSRQHREEVSPTTLRFNLLVGQVHHHKHLRHSPLTENARCFAALTVTCRACANCDRVFSGRAFVGLVPAIRKYPPARRRDRRRLVCRSDRLGDPWRWPRLGRRRRFFSRRIRGTSLRDRLTLWWFARCCRL